MAGLLPVVTRSPACSTDPEPSFPRLPVDAFILAGGSDKVLPPNCRHPPTANRRAAPTKSSESAASKQRRQLHLAELENRADPDVLLVTAADKLHNARAIATDLANQGPAMLQRFSGDADELLWYYDTELELLQRKGVPAILTTPLADAVALIKQRIGS